MENTKLKPETYWEWRTCIAEMQLAEESLRCARIQHDGMNKDQEISRLRSGLFKNSINSLEEKKNLCKKEYEKLKLKIESDLNISLNNTVIDDITFEVKTLES